MREILFRAKVQGTSQWIYGIPSAVYGNGIDCIIQKIAEDSEYIMTDTLCQFTGKKDKDGTKIFDGDFIEIDYKNTSIIMLVFWNEITCGWSIENIHLIDFIKHNKSDLQFLNGQQENIKVIGNKFDNKEHIKQRF